MVSMDVLDEHVKSADLITVGSVAAAENSADKWLLRTQLTVDVAATAARFRCGRVRLRLDGRHW